MTATDQRFLERARTLAALCILGSAASAAAQMVPYEIKNWDFPGAGNTNRLWLASAAGDFNGDGIDEIALIKGAHKQVSIMSSPADKEYELSGSIDVDLTNNQFVGMAAGDMNGDGRDELIILRGVPAGSTEANILVYSFDDAWVGARIAQRLIAAGTQPWIGIAAADMDGNGRADLVVTKATTDVQFSFFELASDNVNITFRKEMSAPVALGTLGALRGVAAGDLNGDGSVEVVAVRQGSGSVDDFIVIRTPLASSPTWESFNYQGGTTHYPWLGVALGEFDRNKANGLEIASHKNTHSYFIYQKYLSGAPTVLAGRDYSSDSQYPWVSIAAGNLMLNDGVDELISVRQHPGTGSTLLTVGVYGDDVTSYNDKLNRLQGSLGFHWGHSFQWMQRTVGNGAGTALDINAFKTYMDQNHVESITFFVADCFADPTTGLFAPAGSEYNALIAFLDLLKQTGSDIKVIVNFATPTQVTTKPQNAPNPGDSPLIGSAELGSGITDERSLFEGGPSDPNALDYVAWFRLLGIVGNKYPNLVGVATDDFDAEVGKKFKPAYLGKMVRALRDVNEHIAFIPTAYYAIMSKPYARNYTDGFVFYSRNDKYPDAAHRTVLTPPDVPRTGPKATRNMHGAIVLPPSDITGGTDSFREEMADMHGWLNNPTKLLILGIYADTHSGSTTEPTPFAVERQMVHAYDSPYMDGVTTYIVQDPTTEMGKTIHNRFMSWRFGYLVYDTFDSQIPGRAPAGWALDVASNTTCTVANDGAGKSLKFTDNNTNGAAGAEKTFTPATGKVHVTFGFRQTAFGAQKFQIKSGSTVAIELQASNAVAGNLVYLNSALQPILLQTHVLNRTYVIDVDADVATDKMDIRVDGVLRASQVPFLTPVSTLDRVMFRSGTAAAAANYTHYVNDVSVAPR